MYHKLFKSKIVQQALEINQKKILLVLHLERRILRAGKIVEKVRIKIQIEKARILMIKRRCQHINLDLFRLKMIIHLNKWVTIQVTTMIQMIKTKNKLY